MDTSRESNSGRTSDLFLDFISFFNIEFRISWGQDVTYSWVTRQTEKLAISKPPSDAKSLFSILNDALILVDFLCLYQENTSKS